MEQSYYLKHRARILQKYKENYQKNKKKESLRHKKYYLKNKERILAHNKEYFKKHKKEINNYRLQWKRQIHKKLKEEIFKKFNNKCVKCGFPDIRALQIDHLDGGGRKDIFRVRNDIKYLRYVLTNLDKFQLLCANCNWIKRYENIEYTPAKRFYEKVKKGYKI